MSRLTRPVVRALSPFLAVSLLASAAHADHDLGDEGEPIATSRYTLDLYRGPVLAGSRVVGLGGAFAPIAEGVAGFAYNPAAVAQRHPWSTEWFDWELDAGVTFPTSLTSVDFDNNGDDSYTRKANFFLSFGGGIQLGDLGLGLSSDIESYRVASRADERRQLEVAVSETLLLVGHSLFDGAFLFGMGLSGTTIDITQPLADGTTLAVGSTSGIAFRVGGLLAPPDWPFRIGLSTRLAPPAAWVPDSVPDCSPPRCQVKDGHFVSDGYYLPRTIALPSEIQAGVAFQLFRPLNFRWKNPEEEPSAVKEVTNALAEEKLRFARDKARLLHDAAALGMPTAPLEDAFARAEDGIEADGVLRLEAAQRADDERRKKPYRGMNRNKLLVSFGAKVTSVATDGVGVESFLEQRVERSGEQVTIEPHLGVESELVPQELVLRAGTYLEPSRFRAGSSRLHGTAGFDVNVPLVTRLFGAFDEDVTFRISAAADVARSYFGWGLGAGLWH
jgi:hypothetical protein